MGLRKKPSIKQVRYYLYVSDAKVDMLFAQIPKPLLTRIAAELKINLKLLSVSLSEKPSEENRYSKLSVVEHYIRRNIEIGTPQQPEAYFQATLPMRWSLFGTNKEVVFFGCLAQQTLIGLTGSSKHVLGSTATASTVTSIGSWTQAVRDMLNAGFSGANNLEQLAPAERTMPPVADAVTHLGGPEENLEFLARRLLYQPRSGRLLSEDYTKGDLGSYEQILLGTPIYVAQAESEPAQ
jgi:hypothetical protein